MRHKQIRDLVFFSILVALELILTVTGWGYINIGGVASFTILHIPVLIGAVVLGKKYGTLLGCVFGLTSMIVSFIYLGVNAPFTNPLLSVLPRALLGLSVSPLYNLLTKKIKNRWLGSALTFGICTIMHSLVVLALLYVVGKTGFYFYASSNPYTSVDGFNVLTFIIACLTINSLIEVLVAMFIGAPISQALDIVIHKEDKQEVEAENIEADTESK